MGNCGSGLPLFGAVCVCGVAGNAANFLLAAFGVILWLWRCSLWCRLCSRCWASAAKFLLAAFWDAIVAPQCSLWCSLWLLCCGTGSKFITAAFGTIDAVTTLSLVQLVLLNEERGKRKGVFRLYGGEAGLWVTPPFYFN